jgi:hypothetical protein
MIVQMKALAGDRHVGRALRQYFDQLPFITGVLDDVDEGSARLLHVAAIIDPALAMDIVESTMAGRSTEELRDGLMQGRRGFVNALEVLIWFDETFERAASALLRLALAENETWSNNATGAIQGVFQVYLGGTSTAYTRRLTWAKSALAENPEADSVLIPGLANALTSHEMRHNPDFASRTAPPEWRPQGITEETTARRGAWHLLIDLARTGRGIDHVATAFADGLRTAAARGLAEDVLSDLASVEWSPSARARLSEAIDDLLKYDVPAPDMAERFQGLRTRLIGSTLDERLAFLLSQEPWQLYHEGQTDKPSPLLIQVADQLATSGLPAILDAARKSRTGDFQTASRLFEYIAMAMPEDGLQVTLLSEEPPPEAAVLGAFVGLVKTRGGEWGLDQLRRWISNGPAGLVIHAAHMLPASGELAALAIQAVREGHSDPHELGRFLYGAWARDLSADDVAAIAELLGNAEQDGAKEQALGIVSQWLTEHPRYQATELDRVAISLLNTTAETSARHSSMIALFREKILARLNVSFDAQLQIITNLLSHLDSDLKQYDLKIIESLAERHPARTIEAVMAVILDDGDRGHVPASWWLERSKILSRLAAAASPEDVVREVEKVPSDRWRDLVAHVNFSQPEPGPVIETLVTKSTDDVTRGRAASNFIYPESGWWGQESDYLRGRRAAAVSWLDSTTSPVMQRWLREIVDELDSRIASIETIEAEEDL